VGGLLDTPAPLRRAIEAGTTRVGEGLAAAAGDLSVREGARLAAFEKWTSPAAPEPPAGPAGATVEGKEEKKGVTTEATTPVEEKAEGARAAERTAETSQAQAGLRLEAGGLEAIRAGLERPGQWIEAGPNESKAIQAALSKLVQDQPGKYSTGIMVSKEGVTYSVTPRAEEGVARLSPAQARAYSEQLRVQEQQRRQAEFDSVAMRGAARDAFKRRDEIERAIAETRKEIETVRGRLTAMNSTANYEREAKELYRPSSKHTYQKAAYLRDRDVQKLLGLQEHLGNLEAARGQAERLGYDLVGRSQARASEAAVLERSGPRLALEAVTRRKDIIEEMARAESQARVGGAIERAGEERAVAGALGPTAKEDRAARKDRAEELKELKAIAWQRVEDFRKQHGEAGAITQPTAPTLDEKSKQGAEKWAEFRRQEKIWNAYQELMEAYNRTTAEYERFLRGVGEAPRQEEAEMPEVPRGWSKDKREALGEAVAAFQRRSGGKRPSPERLQRMIEAISAAGGGE